MAALHDGIDRHDERLDGLRTHLPHDAAHDSFEETMTHPFSLRPFTNPFPTPTSFVPVLPGDTWYFQVSYRDPLGGTSTNNFSDAVGFTFR